MPKVDSIIIHFQGEYKRYEVYFDKKKSFTIKDCPGEIIEFGEFSNTAETLGHLKSEFISAAIKAENTLQNIQKVILVKFTIASSMIGEPISTGGTSIDTRHPLYRFCAHFHDSISGYGFSIDYRVVLEVTQGIEKLYYPLGTKDTTYRRGNLSTSDNETPIPYSEQAVESLERIKASLKEMVTTISKFFIDKDNLQAALESGNLKMLNQ